MPAFDDYIATLNPLIFCKCNETSGTTITNYGSLTGNGTLVNSPTLNVGGLYNATDMASEGGITFTSASTHYIDFGAIAGLCGQVVTGISILAVVKKATVFGVREALCGGFESFNTRGFNASFNYRGLDGSNFDEYIGTDAADNSGNFKRRSGYYQSRFHADNVSPRLLYIYIKSDGTTDFGVDDCGTPDVSSLLDSGTMTSSYSNWSSGKFMVGARGVGATATNPCSMTLGRFAIIPGAVTLAQRKAMVELAWKTVSGIRKAAVVFDLMDRTKLFQDTARTTVCTATHGQLVKGIEDSSGFAAHGSQSTDAQAPKLYLVNGQVYGCEFHTNGVGGGPGTACRAWALSSSGHKMVTGHSGFAATVSSFRNSHPSTNGAAGIIQYGTTNKIGLCLTAHDDRDTFRTVNDNKVGLFRASSRYTSNNEAFPTFNCLPGRPSIVMATMGISDNTFDDLQAYFVCDGFSDAGTDPANGGTVSSAQDPAFLFGESTGTTSSFYGIGHHVIGKNGPISLEEYQAYELAMKTRMGLLADPLAMFLIVGDSISSGGDATGVGGYQMHLGAGGTLDARLLRTIVVRNCSQAGAEMDNATTDPSNTRALKDVAGTDVNISKWVGADPPASIFVLNASGYNDRARSVGGATMLTRLVALQAYYTSMGATSVAAMELYGNTAATTEKNIYNAGIQGMVGDTLAATINPDTPTTVTYSDGVHPNDAGHTAMGEAVWNQWFRGRFSSLSPSGSGRLPRVGRITRVVR